MFHNIKALVFDFDGTLVDASAAICQSFNAALTRKGAPPCPEDEIRKLIGRPLRDMFPAVWPGLSEKAVEELIDAYREVFHPIATTLSKPMPGLRPMLDHFHGKLALTIATSRISDGAYRILTAMDLLDRFDVIVGLQDVTHAKPHPEPILKALEHVRVPPSQAIMVGDVPDDMRAAKSAGTGAVGMRSDQFSPDELRDAGADHLVASLEELITLALV